MYSKTMGRNKRISIGPVFIKYPERKLLVFSGMQLMIICSLLILTASTPTLIFTHEEYEYPIQPTYTQTGN